MEDEKNDKVMDRVLDVLIDEALKSVESMPDLGIPTDEELADLKVSPEFDKRMKKLFRRMHRQCMLKELARNSKRIAVCLLAVIVVAGGVTLSVSAWRSKVFNFNSNTQKTNTEIQLNENNTNVYMADGIMLEYVPDDFALTKKTIADNKQFLRFESEKDYFIIDVSTAEGLMSIDTENAETADITINGHKGILSEKEEINVVSFNDDNHLYAISGTMDKAEVLKIAENLKKY